jgi:hypothetical protein
MSTNPFDHPDIVAYHIEVAAESEERFKTVLKFAVDLGVELKVVEVVDA